MASPAARPATPPPPPATAGNSPERYIEQQLARTRRRLKLVDFFGAAMLLLAGVLAYLLAIALVDHWIVDLGFWGRLVALMALVGGSLWYGLRVLLPLLLRPINPAYAAWVIERSAPSLKNSLINFLLFRSHRGELREAIYRALENRAATDLAHVPIENAIDRSKVIRVGYALAAILAICALYTIISPKDPFQTMARVAMPWSDIVRPSRVQIEEVKPGNAQVLQGETVEVVATILGARPSDTVTLYYSTADRQIVDRPILLEPDRDGWHYRCQLAEESNSESGPYERGVQQAIRYRIEAGDAVTPDYVLELVPAPMMVVERVEYEYPAYTQRPPRIAAQGDISALEGTQVTVHARANQPIRQASLELDPGEDGQRASATFPMKPEELEASRTFTLLIDSTGKKGKYSGYQVRFVNRDGRVSQHPVLHNIEVTPDLPPLVEVLTPQEAEVEVPLGGQQLIEVRAVDPDYGLSRVELRGLAADQVVLEEALLKDEDGYQGQAVLRFAFQPGRLGLKVGDQVRVTATAADHRTDPLSKQPAPNSETTPSYLLKIVAGPQQSPTGQGSSEADQGASGQAAETPEAPQQQMPEETPQAGQAQDAAAQQPQAGQESNNQSDQQQSRQGQQQSDDAQTQGQDQQQQQGHDQQQGQAAQQQGTQAGGQGGQQQQEGTQEARDTQQGSTGDTAGQQQDGQPHPQSAAGGHEQPGGEQPSGNQNGNQQQTGQAGQAQPGDPGAQQTAEQRGGGASRGAGSTERQEELHPGEAFERINQFQKRQQQQAEGQQGQPQAQQQEGAQNPANTGNTGPEGAQAPSQPGAADQDPSGSDGQMRQGSDLPQNGQPQQSDPSAGSRSANETQGAEGQSPQRSPLGQPESREQPGEGAVPTKGTERQPEPSDPGAGQAGDPKQTSPDALRQNANRSKQQESEKMEKPEHEQPPGVSVGKRPSDSQGQDSGEESGGGRQGGGQNTQQQGHDSPGSSSSADEGRGASSESGAGETSQQAGDKQPGQGKDKGSGERPQAGDPGQQGAGGLPQEGQQQEPSGAQEPGAGGSGQRGKAGSQKGSPSKTAGGTPTGGGGLPPDREAPAVQQQHQEVPEGDEADLEYARQATEMALEYLEEQQHNPDPELLKELGWSAHELRQFLADWQRMKQQAVEGQRGEREYDDLLRSLGLRPGEQRMRQGVRADDRIRGMREGGSRTAPPPQFRDQFDAYRRGAARAATPDRQ